MAAAPQLTPRITQLWSGERSSDRDVACRPGAAALGAHLRGASLNVTARTGPRIPLELVGAAMKTTDAFLAALVSMGILHAGGTALFAASLSALTPYASVVFAALLTLSFSGAWRVERRMAKPWACAGVAAGLAGVLIPTSLALFLSGAEGAAWAAGAVLAALALAHALYSIAIQSLAGAGRLSENIVIVGATENARKLITRAQDNQSLNVVGVFDDRHSRTPSEIDGVPVLGSLDDLLDWRHLPEIDRIVVTVTSDAQARVRRLIDRLRVLPQRVVLLLDLAGFDPDTERLEEIAHSPAAYISGAPADLKHALLKRATDVTFALLLMALFAPVFLAIAAAIKLDDGGPVLFRQRRHGFNNQIIRIWKFRSMRPDRISEQRMVAQTFAGDTRITRVGKFIRRTSLDELPQLVNVLLGEMSIVGPRPHALGMTTEQTEVHAIVSDYAHRHRVRPGLTGWAQINGSRGPVHTKSAVRERVRLDLEYVNRASLGFDLYIMLMTAPCLLGDRRNAR
ncbi:MAG: exopolysaccharide biosynthesis polyprenyl glycosylphosphotransferase [Pseudomonadota bacterium]